MRAVRTVPKPHGDVFCRRVMQSERCKISMGVNGGMRNRMILAAVSWMAAMFSAVVSVETCFR